METYTKDAKNIWDDLHTRFKNKKFKELGVEEQLVFYQKQHQRFATTFPIVLRYMVQLRLYHEKAFIKFIKRMQSRPYHSKLEFCERQADYVKYLYRELYNHYSEKDCQEVWTQTYDALKKEVEMFEDAEKKVKLKLDKNNSINNTEKRNELKKMLDMSMVDH
jgi:hypothetical protein